MKERTRVTDRLKDWIEYKTELEGGSPLLCQCRCFSNDLPSNRAAVDAQQRCKCELKDQILSTRSHAAGSILDVDGYHDSHGGGDYG